MSMFDDMKDKAKDIMNDPEKKAKIEQLAKDNNMSIEEARDHYLKHEDQI